MNVQKIRELLSELNANAVIYDVGEGNFAYNLPNADKALVKLLSERLTQIGFQSYFSNRIGPSRFETFVDADLFVHVIYHAAISTLRVVYGPKAYLPSTTPPIYERKVKSTITQTQIQMSDNSIVCDSISGVITANRGAPGMSYLLQIADGRFVMIDGGNCDGYVTPAVLNERGDFVVSEKIKTEDAKHLYDTMCSMMPEGFEKPTVAAWLITHAHGDHMGLPIQFFKTYAGQVNVELLAFNFLNPELDFAPWVLNYIKDFQTSAVACDPTVQTWTLHTGQKLLLPDCTIEVLFTAEDFKCTGNPLGDFNNLSAVFRITIGNTVFMVLGDTYPISQAIMRDAYRDNLKCDILQISHHGFDGSGTARGWYESMDPKICFWACDEFRFRKDKRNLGNATEGHLFFSHYWLRNTPWVRGEAVGERQHYTASYTTVIDAESGKKIN